ncbi:MAG: signal peptidase II [Acidimicrobiales bacterium]
MQERRTFPTLSGTEVDEAEESVRRWGSVRPQLVAVPVLVADQLSKYWALGALNSGPIDVVGPLRFNLTFNRGAAFGLGGSVVPVLAAVAAAAVLWMALRPQPAKGWGFPLSMGLLLGGAFGNLADRRLRGPGWLDGAVVDFIDVGFWPVFNLADCAITIGCVALVLTGRKSSSPPQTQ